MSEEQPNKRHRINLDKVEEFFLGLGIPSTCPFCNGTVWEVPNAASIGGNALPWGTGTGDMFMTGLPILVLVCEKCKFVRQHSLFNDSIPGALEEF